VNLNNILTAIFGRQVSKTWKFLLLIIGLVLLYVTLMPSVHVHSHFRHMDKVFHFIGFGAFAFALMLAFPRLKVYWVILVSMGLGVSVEIIQSFIPRRAFSYWDMVADLFGILFAVLAVVLIRWMINKLTK
jgi:VanZ family protein